MTFNVQAAIDAAFTQADAEIERLKAKVAELEAAAAVDEAKDAEELAAALAADAEQDAITLAERDATIRTNMAVIQARDAEVATLKARIAELEGQEQEKPPPPPPPPPNVFNPRTMTREQMAAATGLQVPATSLTRSGGITISRAGVYENMDFTSRVTANANGGVLVFRNCRFNGGGDYYAFFNAPERGAFDEIRFENCEVRNAVNGIAGANLYMYRCEFTEWENGVNFWGPGQLVECYVHSQKQIGDEPHFDGIECNGGSNVKILRSYIVNSASQTAALMFNNWGGNLSNITVDGNYLEGGGYTVYFDCRFRNTPAPGSTVTNNDIYSGRWGHTMLEASGVVVNAAGGNRLLPRL